MSCDSVEVVHADLDRTDHADAIVELLEVLAQSADDTETLSAEVKQTLAARLAGISGAVILLATNGDAFVGLAVCLEGFSTFKARPLLNIHDLVVHPDWQGRGVARKLLARIEEEARSRGCCRLTLEVYAGNHRARDLYVRSGFKLGEPDSTAQFFLTRSL